MFGTEVWMEGSVMNAYARRAKYERVRQLKIRIAIMIGIMITLILCLVFSIRAFANTDEASVDLSSKQYKSIMIYCNDSVESIAEEYYTPEFSSVKRMEDEIRNINHISPYDELIPGNYLVIPYYNV